MFQQFICLDFKIIIVKSISRWFEIVSEKNLKFYKYYFLNSFPIFTIFQNRTSRIFRNTIFFV